MKPQRVEPLTGFFNFLGCGMAGPLEQKTTKLHDDTIVVDSSLPPDTNIWETGIKRRNIEGKWVIVEQYEDKECAEKGHDKWVKLMTEYPDFPLKDIDMWSLDSLKTED